MNEGGFADFTDVTLAYEDTNSILADNASGAIWWANLQLMQVMPFVSSASSI